MANENEIELCYMVEIGDPDGFGKASATEMHDQYEYKLPPDEKGQRRGKIRIRKTVQNNEARYEETIKTPINPGSLLGDREKTVAIDEGYFNAWRHVYRANGQKKVRYTFVTMDASMVYNGEKVALPVVKFEVDIFIAPNGRRSKWAKIDIEVQDIVKLLKEKYPDVDAARFEIDFSCLPLKTGQVVSMATKDSEERAAIENFFKMFSIPYEAENDGESASATA